MNTNDYLSNSQESVAHIIELYPNNNIIMERVMYCGMISVFLVTFNTTGELESVWDDVSSSIAAYYQSTLKSDFEKYNLYIIYVSKNPVDIGLKYKIENDKFSSRKIVLNEFYDDISEINYNNIITKFIKNTDLYDYVGKDAPVESRYFSNSKYIHVFDQSDIRSKKMKLVDIEHVLGLIVNTHEDEN